MKEGGGLSPDGWLLWRPDGILVTAFMKKIVRQNGEGANSHPVGQKIVRNSVWCKTFGYFIDLDACRARSYQKRVCRRCYASLLQVPLPFDGI